MREFNGTIFHGTVVTEQQEYLNWEREIIDLLIAGFECSSSDAQGILEVNIDMIVDSWKKGLSPMETAEKILNLEKLLTDK